MGALISMMFRSSVSAVGTDTVSVARGQPVPPTTPSCVPNCSTEQTALRAPGESGKGMAKQEDVPTVVGGNNDQRSGPDGTGGTRSAFRPLGVTLFVPRPGPLQRNLHAKRPEDSPNRTRHTSCMSSCPKRNAVTSSYSSTRGFPPVNSRRGPAIPQGLPQKSSKKGSEEGPPSPSAAPVVSRRKSQPDKDAEATRGQKPAWRNCSPTSDSPRPPKRRFPLLPHRRGEPLRLPSPPQLGFRVTAEDLDAEKEARLRRILGSLAPDWPAPAAAAASLPCSISGGPDWQQRGTLYLKRQAPAFAWAPAPPAKRSHAEASSGGGSSTSSTVGTHLKRQAPAFACAPAPPAKRSRAEASSGGASSTNSTMGTHLKRQVPAFACAPAPPAKRSRAEASSGGASSTNSTVGAHASTQLGAERLPKI